MKKLSIVHETNQDDVLRHFKKKSLRPGRTAATRAQEERDLLRALSDFPPQTLNNFDETFVLLDGVGVAVSAPMARRAALYGRNDTTATIEIQGKKDQEPEFLREVVEKLVKPRLNLKAAERKPNYKRSASRRRSEQWRIESTDEMEEGELREWAKRWLQPQGHVFKDLGRFQERIGHRFRCWHAGQAGNGFVPLPVLPPVAPGSPRKGTSRRLVPSKWQTSLSSGVWSSSAELEEDLALSPVSVKDMTMTSIMSGHSWRSCQPHGLFREASVESRIPPLLRCPEEFHEPHRMPNCHDFTSSPEFLYLRVCELSGHLPCSEVWLHFGNGWGIIDAAGRGLGDGDLQALVRTAMICALQGHPLRELNLSGNQLTDVGLLEVLALLRQDGLESEELAGSGMQLASFSIAANSQLLFREKALIDSLPKSIASMSSLSSLDVSRAPLHGPAAIGLATALASCTQLRCLSLAGCGLGCCGQADCAAVASLLGAQGSFPGLERADFSGNFFGAEGFIKAATAVSSSKVHWLSFAGNGNSPHAGERLEMPARQFLRIDGEATKESAASKQNPLQLFLEGLLINDSLEELELSNCSVGVDTAWVLQEALQRHPKLRSLRLSENPLGEAGLRHLLRLITLNEHLEGIDLFGHREADIRCPPVKFRHAHLSGNYRLDLNLVADRAILRSLLRHADSHEGHRFLRLEPRSCRPSERHARGFWLVPCHGACHASYLPPLSEASHRRLREAEAEREAEGAKRPSFQARGSFSTKRLGSLESLGDARRLQPMAYGTGHHGSVAEAKEEKPQVQPGLAGTPEGDWIEVHELLQESRIRVNQERFQLMKQGFSASVTDEERFRYVKALAKELWCTEAQVKQLLESRVELSTQLVCLLFSCIRSRKHQLAFLHRVEPAKVGKVGDAVRGLLWFQDANPTASYNLDLSLPPDYGLAEACLLVNAWESEVARRAGRPDLSQSGNGEMIRNEAYNDTPFIYSKDWLLPSSGYLRFDYSSTRRPPPDANNMTEVSEITRLLRKKELSSRARLQALRAASVHFFISSNQCRSLLQCFPAAMECSSVEAINSGLDESPDRQEALCILHTRVVDRERMLGAEVLYSPVVVSQIGTTDRGASVLVRGGMFRTGDLELKSVEQPVAKGVRHQGSESGAGLEEKLAQETAAASAYFNFLIVLKEQDLLVLYRRLGVLHLLNPYKPEVLRMPVNLNIYEQHRVVDFLVQLAAMETGSRVLCWLDGMQVSVPASWGDKGVPRTAASLTVSYEGHNSSFTARQALADQFCIGFWSK